MKITSSNTCFFSFGPDDSFISKSYEGLRYHSLPPTLLTLITSGSVLDVHWASLGQTPTSWILSFRDSSSTHNLAWGTSIPPRLEKVLSKLTPSPHLRVFLGQEGSYIAWDPTFVRWAGLPDRLEDTLQSWLTPAGWRAGPPRMVSWGPADAFFAMSEYGDVAYRLGPRAPDEWPIWRETVEEWKAERGFRWSAVAYLALDPIVSDQFVALRNDGTWAGSIADENSTALEAFAQNFFRRMAKPKARAKSQSPPPGTQEPRNGNYANGTPARVVEPTPEELEVYKQWSTSTGLLLASALAATVPTATPSPAPSTPTTAPKRRAPKKLQIRSQSSSASIPRPASDPSTQPPSARVPQANLLTSFPYVPPTVTTCVQPVCALQKADPNGLRACKHDVERLLRASGTYGYEWLRQERLRWHPDRFGRLCAEEWRDEGRKLAEEMFKIIDILIADLESARANGDR
ncbi:hypothetical protein BU23DRAFT_42747 [Bimuria novae-zelandiae CBS 107.79]|uniref:Uncharacterized protein n=1 Tax=Bimuria novae-zelandiae CBS 107.79 TaxID=1447943 RepID=A0A6A5VG91_9PLEO|nr:hypothetical protein BU23DRAFT_42747 [Bimuria novae-zelandiae CBS 107.79]